MKKAETGFDRHALMGDVATRTRILLRRALGPLALLLLLEFLYLSLGKQRGGAAFGMIAGSTLVGLSIWASGGRGMPIVPMMLLQTLFAYALPLVTANTTVMDYSDDFIFTAGGEVLIFNLALIAGWYAATQFVQPRKPVSYAFEGYRHESAHKLARLGLILVVAPTALLLLQAVGLVDMLIALLPTGSNSIINALQGATAGCGFFLVAMLAGAGDLPLSGRITLWLALLLSCVITASGLLLSSVIFNVAAVAIGLFWGSGKIPWRFLALVLALLSFFSIGKYAMRAKYWHTADSETAAYSPTVADYPAFFTEWAQTSLDETLGNGAPEVSTKVLGDKAPIESHSLLDRVNNLQNLLFVIDAVENRHIPVLNGATYALVPKLLIPRILWPDKPRTHEGQVMLNVHFGRQDLTSTFQTYVAWGLLAEAYGNFGPIIGCLILGIALGAALAWLENFTARKLVISLEGLVAFVVFLSLGNSFEMVASVLVTSIEQAILPIIIAVTPFVRRQVTHQTAPAAAPPPES